MSDPLLYLRWPSQNNQTEEALGLNSIQHFIENGVPNLQKASKDFSEDSRDFADFVYRVRNEALQMALNYISEILST